MPKYLNEIEKKSLFATIKEDVIHGNPYSKIEIRYSEIINIIGKINTIFKKLL